MPDARAGATDHTKRRWPRSIDLPLSPLARFRKVAIRALRRHCPYCDAIGIFDGYFTLRDQCPGCGVIYDREEGYFLGAYAINLLFALIVGLGGALLLIFGTPLRNSSILWKEAIAVSIAVGLPILFFPFSRTVWIALDLIADPPRSDGERKLRGADLARPRLERDRSGGAGGMDGSRTADEVPGNNPPE
jgi:uncharacterized protein (DUF983 family)